MREKERRRRRGRGGGGEGTSAAGGTPVGSADDDGSDRVHDCEDNVDDEIHEDRHADGELRVDALGAHLACYDDGYGQLLRRLRVDALGAHLAWRVTRVTCVTLRWHLARISPAAAASRGEREGGGGWGGAWVRLPPPPGLVAGRYAAMIQMVEAGVPSIYVWFTHR